MNNAPTYPKPMASEPSRAANGVLAMLDETYLSPVALAMPRRYFIAFSLSCDIECPFCPRQYYPNVIDQGLMKADWLEPVIPPLRYADFVGLFGLGEPFIHPKFFEVLARVKEVGAWTATSTHGMSLNEETCERIIDGGLDELEVSMDGATAETFDFLREGAKFETVVENIRRLQMMKSERNSKAPLLNIACTICRRNVHEMEAMVRLSADLGANQLVFTDLIVIDPQNAGESVYETPNFHENLERALAAASELELETIYAPQKPFPWLMDHHGGRMEEGRDPEVSFGCRSAWGEMNIERQGAAKPCCYLEGAFGNAFEESISDLRNKPALKDVRAGLIGKNLWKECQSCGRLLTLRREEIEKRIADAKSHLTTLEEATLGADPDASGSLAPGEWEYLITLIAEFHALAEQRFAAPATHNNH